MMKTEDRHSVWFCSSCNGTADNTSLVVEYFEWIRLYVWRETLKQGGYKMSGYFDGRNGRLLKALEDLR